MADVFYTYVWGGHGSRGLPLTFTSKANRTIAIRAMNEGDFVFGVVSRNPGDPNVVIPEEQKGRVINVWQISHTSADTVEFGVEARGTWDLDEAGNYRWPYALQPIRTWILKDAPEFRLLPGYSSTTHTQQAITSVQRVEGELAQTLLERLAETGHELPVMTPRAQVMEGRLRQMKQRHPFRLNGYAVEPSANETYGICIATLGKRSGILKIGHAADAVSRVREFNKYRCSNEPQWELHTDQPIGGVRDAIDVERQLGELFERHRTEPNNNEIFVGLDPTQVLMALASMRR